ncbi:MAG: ACT domain-containing protein [Deltaproteobacteria bacterium]|nr:ACT domain-containing protein [Deltaproteobacteria bacterium]
MELEQLSVFLENRAGRLAEVTAVLGNAGINIRALSLADTADFGILRIIVNDVDKALATLRTHGFTATLTKVVAVEVDDQPGGLSTVLQLLNAHDINVEYMYAFVEKSADKALLVFRFENLQKAIDVLTENNIKVLKSENARSI